jgi:hypothetical protein
MFMKLARSTSARTGSETSTKLAAVTRSGGLGEGSGRAQASWLNTGPIRLKRLVVSVYGQFTDRFRARKDGSSPS